MASPSNSWPTGPAGPQDPNSGPPMKPMGLKVLYTFDQTGQQCLARWPQTLQIPIVPIDEQNSIGIVDLRTCLRAIAQGSPEIINRPSTDYTVYAFDYSEPDVPLVGQGMLSWGLDPNSDSASQQQLTGRVTKNLLAVFGNGARETLEVKMRLTPVARMRHQEPAPHGADHASPRSVPTPTSMPSDSSNSEWKSFVQSNPALGRGVNVGAVSSPMVDNRPQQYEAQYQGFPPQNRPSSIPPAPSRPAQNPPYGAPNQGFPPQPRPGSIPPGPPQYENTPEPIRPGSMQPARSNASGQIYVPVGSAEPPATEGTGPQTPVLPPAAPAASNEIPPEVPAPSSRPTSRASRRKNQPTGRPRGRPRKHPQSETGNTSAVEEATDGEGPLKKRAKVTQTDYAPSAPFGSVPDSLRVAASTSGSLRTMRPIGAGTDVLGANHVQDVPRAPTPVPEPAQLPKNKRRRAPARKTKKDAMSEADNLQAEEPRSNQANTQMSVAQDPRSPAESAAQSPDQGYSPDHESPAGLGSSPPVPRTSAYIRSSPPPSSPILPTLPAPLKQVDSGFMSGGIEDYDDDDLAARQLPNPMTEPAEIPPSLPPMPRVTNPADDVESQPQSQPPPTRPSTAGPLVWQEELPGPKELLPVVSIYNPPRNVKMLKSALESANAQKLLADSTANPSTNSAPTPPPTMATLPEPSQAPADETVRPTTAKLVPKKRASRLLKRSNTAPNPTRSEPALPTAQEPAPASQQDQIASPDSLDQQALSDFPELPREAVAFPESACVPEAQLSPSAPVPSPPAVSPAVPAEHKAPEVVDLTVPQEKELPEPAQPCTSTPAPVSNPVQASVEPTIEPTVSEPEPEPNLAQPVMPEPEAALAQLLPELTMPTEPVADMGLTLPSAPTKDVGLNQLKQPPSRPSSRQRVEAPRPPPVPASDPVLDCGLTLPQPPPPMSGPPAPPCPPSDAFDDPLPNKNFFRKNAIQERLENAIAKGEMPPFCVNCGAIETPTWRRIWTRDMVGVPLYHELSDKPGFVTTVVILERDEKGQISRYRLVKKTLGAKEERALWDECQLCNPCGIWLSKYKNHRPADRWTSDAARLNQPRRKRESKGPGSRAKKARTKSDGQMTLTSEAYFLTDPVGPGDHPSPDELGAGDEVQLMRLKAIASMDGSGEQPPMQRLQTMPNLLGSPKRLGPGSTHSRGSGTPASPIAILDDDLGGTRRLLFPSPRKEGVPKVLGELAGNVQIAISQPAEDKQTPKVTDKENLDEVDLLPQRAKTPAPENDQDDDLELELFGTPPARPSTPPPRSASNQGPFKTPTRPTPSRRPITRSISRSVRSAMKSPGQALLQVQRTPTRTPRSGLSSASKRRAQGHAQFALDIDSDGIAHLLPGINEFNVAESPFTAGLNQLLSEANDFTAGSPLRHLAGHLDLTDIDISSLPNIDSEGILHQHLAAAGTLDFGNLLSDMPMPSSPPPLRSHTSTGKAASLFADTIGEDLWSELALLKSDKPEEAETMAEA